MRGKKNTMVLTIIASLFCLGTVNCLAKDALPRAEAQQTSGTGTVKKTPPARPPLPPGTTELNFSEFFVSPVGDRGLTFTDKLQSLDGRRVRILGYMVRQEASIPGRFLLAPLPVILNEHDSAFADDLPTSTVHVIVPGYGHPVPHTAKPLLLTGFLSVGNREEVDGRISIVRLTLDALPPPARTPKTFSNEKGAQRLLTSTARDKAR